MLTPRIQMLRERHLSTPPCTSADRISLFTKASQTFVNEPPVLVRARAFDYVLRNTKLHISPGELLVGSHTDKDRCAPIFPEYSSAQWIIDQIDLLPTRPADPLQLNPEDREEILRCLRWWNGKSLQDFTDNALPEEIRREEDCGLYTVGSRDTATGHITANYKRLLREGLNGYIARCRGKIRETVGGSKEAQEKINFWRACIISAEGVIAYAQRFSVLAAEQAAAENDPERRAELLEISRICAKVPAEPAGTFYEAMQFVWFVQIMLHLETPAHANSLFRFDQYMYPYYKADKEAGRITDERVIELLQCLYIKVSDLIKLRNSYYSSAFAGYVMWPTLVIGGQDKDGHDASNELSYLVLEASDGVKLQSPSICLRVCDETPDSLIDKGAQMNQDGQANPAFFGDTVTVPMMLQKGASLEDARDWGIVGCIEPHPGGGASEGSPTSGYLNGLKCLELVLHNGVDPLTGKEVGLKTGDPLKFTGIEQIMDALKAQCIHCYDNMVRFLLDSAKDVWYDTEKPFGGTVRMIGKKIKYYRKQVNLSLKEISERTGLSMGYLSNLERDQTSPTYDNLCSICDAMSVSVVDLIMDTVSYQCVIKKNERPQIYSNNYRVKYEFTTDKGLNMQGMCLTFPEDYWGVETSWGHDTDEFGIVTKGAFAFEINCETYILEEGDSIYIKARTPHKWRKITQGECVSYWTKLNYVQIPSQDTYSVEVANRKVDERPAPSSDLTQ